MPRYRLLVNGQPHEVHAAADTPLLWVLRDHLALTGTKYGCGIGNCGACMIQLDGAPQNACLLPVSAVGAHHITTIEGLAGSPITRLRAAWHAEDVPQCGYCQVGQLMSAEALLREHASPTDAQIDGAMGRHICRCGTYQRIKAAIHRAAEAAR